MFAALCLDFRKSLPDFFESFFRVCSVGHWFTRPTLCLDWYEVLHCVIQMVQDLTKQINLQEHHIDNQKNDQVEKPIECNEINVSGTLVVLEEAARAKVRKLIFSSSAAIYGNNPVTPKIETMLPEPHSPYAITKLDGEYYCQMFTFESKVQTACLRYFNVFGPRQDPKSQYAAAVPIFIDRAVKRRPITIFGDGKQTRDFIYVKDVVAANVFFAMRSPATGVFNVACGRRITINVLARRILGLVGAQTKIKHAPTRRGDVKHSMASIEKLRAADFVPERNFRKGLTTTVKHFTLKQSNNKVRH